MPPAVVVHPPPRNPQTPSGDQRHDDLEGRPGRIGHVARARSRRAGDMAVPPSDRPTASKRADVVKSSGSTAVVRRSPTVYWPELRARCAGADQAPGSASGDCEGIPRRSSAVDVISSERATGSTKPHASASGRWRAGVVRARSMRETLAKPAPDVCGQNQPNAAGTSAHPPQTRTRPSPTTSTVTDSPSRTSPARMARASWSPISFCTSLRSGRAP